MKKLQKPLAIILAVLTVFAVAPFSFAAVETDAVAVGDKVAFGKYEQDGDSSTTDEVLTWIVVEKKDAVLTIISEKCLNAATNCSTARNKVGAWGKTNVVYKTFIPGFIDAAFTAKEKAALVPVDNGATDTDGTTPLVDTPDLVYIPSKAEIEAFFPNAADAIAYNTASAAKTTGAAAVDKAAKYYLRDTGYSKNASTNYCSYVDENGVALIPDATTATTSLIKSDSSKAKVAVRLTAKIDMSKLFTTGKDAETGIIPMLGTLGTFTVRWLDTDGTVVASELVDYGDPAVKEPALDMSVREGLELHNGYKFAGWNKDFSCITADTDITAVFEELPQDSTFMAAVRWIWGIIELLKGLITTNVIPIVKDWISETFHITFPEKGAESITPAAN